MQTKCRYAIRVYLVGEEALSRESLGAMLSMDSALLVVGAGADLGHALPEIGTRKVDVVLLDMQMSSINVIEATQLLKEKHPRVPLVILTSNRSEPSPALQPSARRGDTTPESQ